MRPIKNCSHSSATGSANRAAPTIAPHWARQQQRRLQPRAPGLPWLPDGVTMALVRPDLSAAQQKCHRPYSRFLPPMPSMPEFWQGWRVSHSRTVLPFYLPLSKWAYRWPRSRRCTNQRTHTSLSCSLTGLKARGNNCLARVSKGVGLAGTAQGRGWSSEMTVDQILIRGLATVFRVFISVLASV